MRHDRLGAAVLAVIGGLGLTGAASATDLTWSPNGDQGVSAGSGTWDTNAGNLVWWDGLGQVAWPNNTSPLDNALFTGPTNPANAGGTVTFGSDIVAGTITFDDSLYVLDLNGNDLTANIITTTANVFGVADAVFTNTSATQSVLTVGNDANSGVQDTSRIRLAGNLAVVVKDTSWTPSGPNTFTGDLTITGTVATTVNISASSYLGASAGRVIAQGNTTMHFKDAPDGAIETFTREFDFASTSNVRGVGGRAARFAGAVSGEFRVGADAGQYIFAADNTNGAGAGLTSITVTSSGVDNFAVVFAHDKAFGDVTSYVPSTSSSAVSVGFAGDADGSTNIDAVAISGLRPATSTGLGTLHNYDGNNTFAGTISGVFSDSPFPINVEPDSSLTLTGVIGTGKTTNGNTRGITKTGAGKLVLTAENQYGYGSARGARATFVQAGTLSADFSQSGAIDANIVPENSALVLSGGTLEVIGGSTGDVNSQSFYNASSAGNAHRMTAGASTVKAVQNDAASLTVSLGRLVATERARGATVNFITVPTGANSPKIVLPTGGIGTDGQLLTVNSVAYATFGSDDWAALDADTDGAGADTADRSIVGGSSLTGFYTTNDAISLSGNADMAAVDGSNAPISTTLASGGSVNSLRFNSAGARSVTIGAAQTLTTGGILVGTGVGTDTQTITGGKLAGAAAQDLVVFQHNPNAILEIGSQIVDNGGATGLTKSGKGTLVLSGDNSTANGGYTGTTYLNEGMLKVANANALGGGNLSIKGGVLGLTGNFTRAIGTGANQVQFQGAAGFAAYDGNWDVSLGQTVDWHTDFVRTGEVLTLGANDATGTVTLTDAMDLADGSPIAVMQRTIHVENSEAPGMENLVEARISGRVHGTGGITKTGDGTLELSYSAGTNPQNDYSGPTNIKGGTLLLTGKTSGSMTTPVTVFTGARFVVAGTGAHAGTLDVRSGGSAIIDGTIAKSVNVTGTLGGSGTISGAVTIGNGGTVAPGNSIESLAIGDLTLANGSTLDAEINTSDLTADLLDATGNLTLTGNVTLDLTDLGGDVPLADGIVFTLIQYTGAWNGGTFAGLADGSLFSYGSNSYQINYDDDNAVTLTTAVPEPATLGLLALGGLAMVRRRVRKS